ncbi:hypothetical protein A2U01_0107226, partial [Trifolium medium]|nr:hypothetical protein [Trifolium medium]
ARRPAAKKVQKVPGFLAKGGDRWRQSRPAKISVAR